MFERELKERNSEKKELSYDIKELHTFIDRLVRLSRRHISMFRYVMQTLTDFQPVCCAG